MTIQPDTPAAVATSTRHRAARVDAVCGAVVAILGIATLVQSLRMPRFEERGATWLTAPGLTPALIGVVLAILGTVLMLRGMRGRAPAGGAAVKILDWDRGAAQRTALTLALVMLYGLVLFGHAPFVPATAGFIFAFTVGAEWLAHAHRLPRPGRTLIGAALLAIIGAIAIKALFQDVFLVQIPG